MALSRYVLTATTTVPAGTPATVAAGEPGTGAPAGPGSASVSAGYGVFPQTLIAGTAIVLDSASPLYTYLNGQGALRPYVQGNDDRGGAGELGRRGRRKATRLIWTRSPDASRSPHVNGPPA